MKLACLLGRHEARATAIRNQGLYFSRCARCERDMVRSLGGWQPVPRGFRVVWRSSTAPGPITANLPVPSAAVAKPISETLSRLAAFAAMAQAGIRALLWSLSDRVGSLRRRPALLRLPAS